jgi:hypothetical protein
VTDTEIEDTKAWGSAGYLRFDHHVTRLYPTNFESFYERSFNNGGDDLPKHWLQDNSWSNAPAAAFPSYSFSVKQGGGGNVSLPISGIPIGLGLMGARSAQGYVAIGDARTYGVDESSLMGQVQEYVANHEPDILRCLGADYSTKQTTGKDTPRFYLQIVSRVYLTGKVTVSMVNDASVGGSLSGGAPKDVPIPDAQSTNAASNYANLVGAVNTNLSSLVSAVASATTLAPGATIKFAAVSSRSVSMTETFSSPLVIGYVGFSWPLEIFQKAGALPGQPAVGVRLMTSGPYSLDQFFKRIK